MTNEIFSIKTRLATVNVTRADADYYFDGMVELNPEVQRLLEGWMPEVLASLKNLLLAAGCILRVTDEEALQLKLPIIAPPSLSLACEYLLSYRRRISRSQARIEAPPDTTYLILEQALELDALYPPGDDVAQAYHLADHIKERLNLPDTEVGLAPPLSITELDELVLAAIAIEHLSREEYLRLEQHLDPKTKVWIRSCIGKMDLPIDYEEYRSYMHPVLLPPSPAMVGWPYEYFEGAYATALRRAKTGAPVEGRESAFPSKYYAGTALISSLLLATKDIGASLKHTLNRHVTMSLAEIHHPNNSLTAERALSTVNLALSKNNPEYLSVLERYTNADNRIANLQIKAYVDAARRLNHIMSS